MSNELAQSAEHQTSRSSQLLDEKAGVIAAVADVSSRGKQSSLLVYVALALQKEAMDFSSDTIAASNDRDHKPSSTTLAAPSAGDDSSLTATDSSKKTSGLLPVPSRSSSRKLQPSPTATGLSGLTASDPAESIGRASRDSNASILGKKRNGSVTSSKRAAPRPEVSEKGQSEANARASQSAQMPNSKKSRGFLSFLNCCSAPDDANGIDAEQAPRPVKEGATTQSQTRGPTPSKPTAAETKADQKQAEDSKTKMMSGSEGETAEKNGGTPTLGENALSEKVTAPSQPNGQVSNAQPGSTTSDKPSATLDTQPGTNPMVLVEAPTPTSPSTNITKNSTHPDDSSNIAKNDPGTEKAAALPPAPEVQDAEIGGTHATYTALPLPLPSQNQEGTSAAPATSEDVIVPEAADEKQQWLLPPVAPRFKGKKCLVLDLDETLVHSSFKVRLAPNA